MPALSWLADSSIGVWVRESLWGYPIVLTCHAIGMALVVGPLLMFNLTLLGYTKRLSPAWIELLFPIAWVGFAVNAVSGVCLFAAEPDKFLGSTAFLIKLVLILAGGVSVGVAQKFLNGDVDPGASRRMRVNLRLVAALSLAFWVGAIVAGRLIAYTADKVLG